MSQVNWPDKEGLHKVIQLEIDGNPLLRFGTQGHGLYHASILKQSLEKLGIKYQMIEYDSHPDGMVPMGEVRRRFSYPSPTGERYALVGAGYANVDLTNKIAKFEGESQDYNLGINTEHLAAMMALIPEWTLDF